MNYGHSRNGSSMWNYWTVFLLLALFNGVGDRENLVLMEFLPLSDKVIKHSTNGGLIVVNSTKNHDYLVQSIMSLVINRRKNLHNSRKVKSNGTRKLKTLRLIYFCKSEIIVKGVRNFQGSRIPVYTKNTPHTDTLHQPYSNT